MTPLASRLKDVLWSLRQKNLIGKAEVDYLIAAIVLGKRIPVRLLDGPCPESFRTCLLFRVKETILRLWYSMDTQGGYQNARNWILSLEDVARYGFEGCQLTHDTRLGWQLGIKPEYRACR